MNPVRGVGTPQPSDAPANNNLMVYVFVSVCWHQCPTFLYKVLWERSRITSNFRRIRPSSAHFFTFQTALAFVNDPGNSTHGSVRIGSIFLSTRGEWRLGGFEVLSSPKDEAAVLYVRRLTKTSLIKCHSFMHLACIHMPRLMAV